MASRSGTASRLTLALTQLALAAALVACGTDPTPTAITAQPTEQSVVVNGTARFVLAATGDGLKFQWQRSTNSGTTWTNVVGATQAVLEIANVTADQNGHLYRAQVSGDDGAVVVTSAVALHCDPVVVAPSFTVNLASPAEITEGADITLAVTAAGTSLTYLWETSPAGSSSWSALSGNNSPQLQLNDVPSSDNGRRYRVTISNSAGSLPSQTATLSVKATPVTPTAPSVTTQPAAVSVKAPAAATFSVAVSGKPTPTVQWQTSATNSSNAADWTDISGANDLTYRIASTTNGLSGYYRAKVSNSVDTVYSQAAKLTVTDADVAPKISTQPANQTVTVGAQASFTVAASGTPTPTIQWQISSNGGGTWTNINGATSATYSFTTSAVGTSQYRAVASNGVSPDANSDAATLTVSSSSSPEGPVAYMFLAAGSSVIVTLSLDATGRPSFVSSSDICRTGSSSYGTVYSHSGIAVTRSGANLVCADGQLDHSVASILANKSITKTPQKITTSNNYVDDLYSSKDHDLLITQSYGNQRDIDAFLESGNNLTKVASFNISNLPNNYWHGIPERGLGVAPSGKSIYQVAISVQDTRKLCPTDVNLVQLDISPTHSISYSQSITIDTIPCATASYPFGDRIFAFGPSGRYMYVATYGTSTIHQFELASSGAPTKITPSQISVDSGSARIMGLIANPTGKAIYAVDQSSNKIWQFGVGPNGNLSQLVAPSVQACPSDQVYAFGAADPITATLYITCDQSLRTFSFGSDGSLSLKSTIRLSDLNPLLYTSGLKTFAIH